MKPTNILDPIRRMFILAGVLVAFNACQKEFSIENGGYSGTAEGELVDSLGYCKNISVQGNYIVDTPLTTSNYVTVNVNFTAAGKYKIYSDTVNGMWFLDSGFVVSAGQTAIKLKGKGTPLLAKTTDFGVFFGNNLCNFSITVTGTGGSSGGGGATGNTDYFPLSVGSNWEYQYVPKLGSDDKFTVTTDAQQVQVNGDPLVYWQFGTTKPANQTIKDTFYFAQNNTTKEYYALSSIDFDYFQVFDSLPNYFLSYVFLKPAANAGDTWETVDYGKVRLTTGSGSTATVERGVAKAAFTVISKNTAPYTIGGKQYNDVINIKRTIMFKPDGGSYRSLFSGNSYYAKGYGLIDQVIGTAPNTQAISITKTPTIK